MKTILIAVLSFLIGVVISGLIGYKMFIGLAQMNILSEMYAHSVSLEMISENKANELQQSNCFVLNSALRNYSQFSDSFWASENVGGTPEMTKEFLLKVKKQVRNTDLCKNTLQGTQKDK